MTGANTFEEKMTRLSDIVGRGVLTGHLIVDQVYAKYQHENLTLNHPHGGHAKYLTKPLFDNRDDYMGEIAATVLEDGGRAGMIGAMEHLSGEVAIQAPVLWGFLRNSGHPIVDIDGEVIYDREPEAHRLTEEELRALGRLTPLPPELLGWIWWHVEHHIGPPLGSGWRRKL